MSNKLVKLSIMAHKLTNCHVMCHKKDKFMVFSNHTKTSNVTV